MGPATRLQGAPVNPPRRGGRVEGSSLIYHTNRIDRNCLRCHSGSTVASIGTQNRANLPLSPFSHVYRLCPAANKAIVTEVADFVVSLEVGWRVVGEAV